MKKNKKKEFYFFVAYQVYKKNGILMTTGDSLEGIEADVEDGEYEHFGINELKEKLLKGAIKINPSLKYDDGVVIITSLSEISKELWYQLSGEDIQRGSI